jgi:hypothetical protein
MNSSMPGGETYSILRTPWTCCQGSKGAEAEVADNFNVKTDVNQGRTVPAPKLLLCDSPSLSLSYITKYLSDMAHLLRGKQAGVQKDLSLGITPEFFAVDDVGHPHSYHPTPLTSSTIVCPLWRQFPDFHSRLRCRSISPRCWDQ